MRSRSQSPATIGPDMRSSSSGLGNDERIPMSKFRSCCAAKAVVARLNHFLLEFGISRGLDRSVVRVASQAFGGDLPRPRTRTGDHNAVAVKSSTQHWRMWSRTTWRSPIGAASCSSAGAPRTTGDLGRW